MVLFFGGGLAETRWPTGALVQRVRPTGKSDHRRYLPPHDHDYVAGFHGPLDLQPEESHEVLQGIPASRRQADTILRLQHDWLSRTGSYPTRSFGTGAHSRPQRRPSVCSPADCFRIRQGRETQRTCAVEVLWSMT